MSQKSNNQVTHCYKLQLSYLGQSRYPHFKGRETETGKLTHLPEATHGFKTRSRTGTELRPSSFLRILKCTMENPSLKSKCNINLIFHKLCILVKIHTLFKGLILFLQDKVYPALKIKVWQYFSTTSGSLLWKQIFNIRL